MLSRSGCNRFLQVGFFFFPPARIPDADIWERSRAVASGLCVCVCVCVCTCVSISCLFSLRLFLTSAQLCCARNLGANQASHGIDNEGFL